MVLHDTWRLARPLGEGATSEVYEAVDASGRRGAVKLLREHLRAYPEALERFCHEGRIAARVEHPGIVAVLDESTTDDGTPFIVMELLEGETLDERLEASPTGRLDEEETCRLGIELCDVLEAVHAANILHRDLKPDNLFVTHEGVLKVIDFGIARAKEQPGTHRTRLGIAMGTPGYMPVEQAAGDWDHVDVRTDLWAAGAVLYRCLTGECVHEEETLAKTLCAAMTRGAAPVAHRAPRVGRKLAAVIDKALEIHPADRWPSAGEMKRALEAALEDIHARRSAALEEEAYAAVRVMPAPLPRATPSWREALKSPMGMAAVFAVGVSIPVLAFFGTRMHPADADMRLSGVEVAPVAALAPHGHDHGEARTAPGLPRSVAAAALSRAQSDTLPAATTDSSAAASEPRTSATSPAPSATAPSYARRPIVARPAAPARAPGEPTMSKLGAPPATWTDPLRR